VATATLGTVLGEARAAHDLSLQEVADRAGCSPGYVHKLESDRVRTPSPRVLAGLARALGLGYGTLMAAAGYGNVPDDDTPAPPTAVKRFSNAHIVSLLERLQSDMDAIKARLG
jgi:transcriptional regulator with XRE-family HTH domain